MNNLIRSFEESELANAIQFNKDEIAKLKAMKILLSCSNADIDISISGMKLYLRDKNVLNPLIDQNIQDYESWNVDNETRLKELQSISLKIDKP